MFDLLRPGELFADGDSELLCGEECVEWVASSVRMGGRG